MRSTEFKYGVTKRVAADGKEIQGIFVQIKFVESGTWCDTQGPFWGAKDGGGKSDSFRQNDTHFDTPFSSASMIPANDSERMR